MSSESYKPVENLDWCGQVLSDSRLWPYVGAVNGDVGGALKLYALNIKVSAELLTWLAFLEVALRNSLIRSLRPNRAKEDFDVFLAVWTDLTPEERGSYMKATSRVSGSGARNSFHALVTELPFGFWKHLLSSKHQTTLWASNLRHAFPYLRPHNRAFVYKTVEAAVELRNRIAHHEPIFRRQLGADLAQIQQIIGWISPDALDWAVRNLPGELIDVRHYDHQNP